MKNRIEQIGLMGGTFNPIHHGHLIAARAALETLNLDRLLLIPNARSPLRRDEELADPLQRFEMVRLAVEGEPGLEACDMEVRRTGLSYLVDTLEEVKKLHPDADLFFLMGVDSLDTFDRWRNADKIVDLATVTVIPRPGNEGITALQSLETRAPVLKGRITLLKSGPYIDISASQIRQRLMDGKSVRYLLPEAVVNYIATHQLYGPVN